MENPEAAPPTPDKWSRYAARAEAIAKLAAAVGILCYGLGLIVTNTYLTRYGMTDFSLLRAQCILTGCWTAVLLFLATLPAAVAAHSFALPSKYPTFVRLLRAIGYGAFGLIVSYVLVAMASIPLVGPFDEYRLSSFNATLPWWSSIMVLMNGIPFFFILLQHKQRPSQAKTLSKWIYLIVPSVFFVSFAVGGHIYEVISPEMGGGRPQHGQLFFSSEDKELPARLKRLTSPYHDDDPDGAIAGDLIYMGSDRYAFRVTYCGPPDQPGPEKTVYKEQDFIADKKTMQAFFLDGLSGRQNGSECIHSLPRNSSAVVALLHVGRKIKHCQSPIS